MKVIVDKNNGLVELGSIGKGTIFQYKGLFYIKMSTNKIPAAELDKSYFLDSSENILSEYNTTLVRLTNSNSVIISK